MSKEIPTTLPSNSSAESSDKSPADRRIRFYRALRDAGYRDVTIVSREDLIERFNHRHLEIIDFLREHDAESVRGLARDLGYDKKDISEDLALLARLDVIEFRTEGRRKVPSLAKDHIVVEPLA
jgi:predicted transcriptional regulator